MRRATWKSPHTEWVSCAAKSAVAAVVIISQETDQEPAEVCS